MSFVVIVTLHINTAAAGVTPTRVNEVMSQSQFVLSNPSAATLLVILLFDENSWRNDSVVKSGSLTALWWQNANKSQALLDTLL